MQQVNYDSLWDYDRMSVLIHPTENDNPHGVVSCGELSNATCQRIIDEHKNDKNLLVSGRVQKDGEFVDDTTTRDVDAWIINEDNAWIDDIVANTTYTALEYLKYDVVGLLERPQLLRYKTSSKGYTWHTDLGEKEASIRKISISINLNNGYEGGALSFFSNGLYKLQMHKGLSVAFPSFLSHMVEPIKKGERWSLVAWISGHPFR